FPRLHAQHGPGYPFGQLPAPDDELDRPLAPAGPEHGAVIQPAREMHLDLVAPTRSAHGVSSFPGAATAACGPLTIRRKNWPGFLAFRSANFRSAAARWL